MTEEVTAPAPADPLDTRGPRHRRRRRRRPTRRRWVLALIALLALSALAAGWLAWQGERARGQLRDAAALVGTLQSQLGQRDVPGAQSTLAELQRRTAAARDATSDPVWAVGGVLPWIGDDLHAVRSLASAADDLSRDALPGLVAAAEAFDPRRLAPRDGRIPLDAILQAAPAVIAGDDAVRMIAQRVAALDRPGLNGRVRDAVRTFIAKLAAAQQETAAAARMVRLLPPMLGATGPRTYLLVFQNLAEVRATGGIWGAWATVHVEHGKLTLERQGSAADINAKLHDIRLNPALIQLYGEQMSHYFQDANFTPDFPTAAELGREMYKQAYGESVDGVLATDPVALSYLLKGAPPVALPGGTTLTADNAVSLLLNTVYLTIASPTQQDLVFAAAARAAFGALSGGAGSTPGTLDGIRRAAHDGHLLVWSATAAEQADILQSTLAGSLAGPGSMDLGVFLNDDTGAKMDYYLTESIATVATGCGSNNPGYEVSVTLESTAPAGLLPPYVTGQGLPGLPRNSFRTNVLLVTPLGGGVSRARIDGMVTPIGSGIEKNRQVGVVTVDLAPAARHVIVFDVAAAPPMVLQRAPEIRANSAIRVTPQTYRAC